MTINEIKNLVNVSPNYEFLRTHPSLGENICLLTLGGSYAYGTNIETSDVDVRGIALNNATEILIGSDFEQVLDSNTDTTIYSFKKIIHLLTQCNPNTIEILGCKPEQYIILDGIGQALLDHKDLFLSKRCVNTFGGYAISQLRRLENISNKYVSQSQQEQHILDSINNARFTFKDNYFPMDEDAYLNLYIDDAINPEYEKEIFMDINLHHYPLRDYANMWNEMKSIVSSYNRLGKRNQRALDHNKIGKHMMHLIRLYMMCIDILSEGKIVTYREKEHDLLMDIRNGKFLDDNQQPTKEFSDMVDEYEAKLKHEAEISDLPDHPDMDKINDFICTVNSLIISDKDMKERAWRYHVEIERLDIKNET